MSTPNEGFFRDSSSYVLHEASHWRLILIECLRYGYFMLWPCHAGQGEGAFGHRSTIWVDYASENRVPQSEYPMYVNFP